MVVVAGSKPCVCVVLLLMLLMADVEKSAGSTAVMWGDEDAMEISSFYSKNSCDGSIGDCFTDEEMLMDSEINRRILAATQHISYGALKGDSVPCSKKGTSYYNCGESGEANPYKRPCTMITRCARDTG
ncbi:hypothetical protein SUGI_0201890 [Cryptomeria japonica]|uniref:protein RALF-like 33 n=1 Tax=Cryptomeria japonica TaxID=3369 RepID=UPI002408B5A0|nr:protein RALF-like 33 [Cryptomeria japonica]GLJ12972.1 hypothetical protein SUGI_0201890 [Cryptomeria japonica]